MNRTLHSLPHVSLTLALALAASTFAGDDTQQYARAPRELGDRAPRVGEWITDVAFDSLDGTTDRLSSVAGQKGLLVVMRDPECPLSKKYSPRLAELSRGLPGRGIEVLFVNHDDVESGKADVEDYALRGNYAVDPEMRIARELRARTSTEVFLLDSRRTLVYRGMVDDQYGLGFSKPEPANAYLARAVDALVAGRSIAMPATEAQGCLLEVEEEAAEAAEPAVTYHNRISRIVQNRCESCHRTGAAGPFELSTYTDVKRKKGMIQWVVEEKVMPPWFAAEDSGPWLNDTSLTDAERRDLLGWIEAGCPEGDEADAPLPRTWTEGWNFGEPDYVVTTEEAFEVPAEGVVDYQYAYVQTDLEEDRWLRAIEIRSEAPQVVHHVLVFLEDPSVREAAFQGDRSAQRVLQEGSDGFFAGAVPGQPGQLFDGGYGKRLPAGAWLKFQIHYTPNGQAASDRTSVGFFFADRAPRAEIRTESAHNEDFLIPAGAFDYEVSGEMVFSEDARILSLFPHTHLRGFRFNYELVSPQGAIEPLLEMPFYDFNWQFNYRLATPREVPAGTRLRATAWYDNTPDNPTNPDATRAIRFGEQTTDEMMIGYVNWVPASAGSR